MYFTMSYTCFFFVLFVLLKINCKNVDRILNVDKKNSSHKHLEKLIFKQKAIKK